jgi:OmcA/MtrC family decaheme c-type cytochrome
MRTRMTPVLLGRISILSAVLLGSALLISSPQPTYSKRDKAYYMDENQASFVRPGLVISVTKAEIANDGTVRAYYKLTDPKGLPLDREGIITPGAVSTSFIFATIPNGQKQYTAYTTRVQTSPITGKSATQAGADSGGTFAKLADGEYVYTFRTKAPSTFDKTATHTIGAYGSRNLSEFDLGTQYDDDVYTFVPDGSAVKVTRDVVRTETCNKCHDSLGLHGGSRKTVPLCVLCHSPQTVDPDTGNSVDMVAMTHKIHAGSALPSVQAGKPYQIIGNAQSVHDYSEIAFPADARNCNACHEQDNAAQKEAWLKPSRQGCGSCHDDINFASGEGHRDLPQVSDNQCANCHTAEGELEFDASIKGAHQLPRFSKMLPGLEVKIVSLSDGAAGKKPTVGFTIKDKKGNPIAASKLDTLRVYWGGPTSDYAGYNQEDARKAECNSDGLCYWTFAKPIPSDAKGSFAAYIEGYRSVKLLEGTKKEITQRDVTINPVYYFSVDGSKVAPRRTVVAIEKCNACHSNLAMHGDQRNTIEGCIMCHNPNETDAARRPANMMPAETVDFKTMIHRLHTGLELEREYTIYGFGGTANDMTKFGYPGDRRNCNTCHVGNSQQLPMREGTIPVKNSRGLVDPMLPTTAACTACHSSRSASSHALVNTSQLGESCATCHGPNAEFSVDKAHAR